MPPIRQDCADRGRLVYNLDAATYLGQARGRIGPTTGHARNRAVRMLACQQVRTDVTAPTPLSSSALAAFVRGIERRALVVAEFQTGEVLVAERAVAVAMRAFVPAAVDQPMAGWSTHFWRLLATTPQLRDTAADGLWPQDLAHLSQLADADRMALLLRIGAGLDEQQAAEVLGVPVSDRTPSRCAPDQQTPATGAAALRWTRYLPTRSRESARDRDTTQSLREAG